MRSRAKPLGLILILGLAITAAVVGFLQMRDSETPLSGFEASGRPLLDPEGFGEDDVATIEIATAEGSVRLAREAGDWVVRSQDGFPADSATIHQLIDRVMAARILYERRVEQTELSQYGLQPVSALGSAAVRLSFRDAADGVLLDLRIGNVMSLPDGVEMETLIALPEERLVGVLDQDLGFSWSSEDWLRQVDLGFDGADVVALRMGGDEDAWRAYHRNSQGRWLFASQAGEEEPAEKQGYLRSAAKTLADLPLLDAARSEADLGDVEWRRTIVLGTGHGARVDYRIVGTKSGDWVAIDAAESACDGDPSCERVKTSVAALSGWFFKMSIASGSDIELAYMLSE
ncbi:hypothetical protein KAJ83_14605 [Marivibrio halodurans]|uniref:DUF4340 domain-containing protein n=1 Tax=Marivibrio halodurans TaxID=2039722 RepID=A0A8J7SK71_9PROT|nr:hypothetical protein [Marivibrio halodurans]MBP5858248.1 hypothetical protein [Marivibrio halodurans]